MGLPAVREGSLRPARRALAAGGELPADLRDTIRMSWIRSRLADAPMDRISVPHREADGASERLVRAAGPILDRFAEQLTDTNVSIVLADANARVVGRWAGDHSALRGLARLCIDDGFVLAEDVAGTNGIGTVLEELRPVTIFGEEHYSEPLHRLVCVGAPIRNPLTRRIVGVLDLACPTSEATGLLVPTLLDLGAQIEQELIARSSSRERMVFDEFLARCRETPAAVVGLSPHYMVTNAAAADLLAPNDQGQLWEQVHQANSAAMTLTLASGTIVRARCTHIRMGSMVAGVLIEFVPRENERVIPPTVKPMARRSHRMTDSDLQDLVIRAAGRLRIIGEQGAGKLTAATRIHRLVSPHESLTIHPVGLAQVVGPREWLHELQARLGDPRGTVVLRNLESLDGPLEQSLSDLLDRQPDPVPLIIGTQRSDRGPDRSALQSRFGDTALTVPALRQQREHLADVVYDVLRSAGYSHQVGHRAMTALINFSWPGNFPQLQKVVREAARQARGSVIGVDDLDEEVAGGGRGRRPLSRLETVERAAIVDALSEHRGNRSQAALALGLSRSTLYRRLRQFGLDTRRTIL